eukprot:g41540.t1
MLEKIAWPTCIISEAKSSVGSSPSARTGKLPIRAQGFAFKPKRRASSSTCVAFLPSFRSRANSLLQTFECQDRTHRCGRMRRIKG